MKLKDLSPEVRQIWKVAKVVQGLLGLTTGFINFTEGPLLYEKLSQATNPQLGMTLTTLLFGVQVLLIALFEVPTGAFADAVGRKWGIVWSFVARMSYLIFFGLIPFTSSLSLLIVLALLFTITCSLATTLFSGTFTAWCVDSLRHKAPNIGYEHLLSKAYIYNFTCLIIGGVLSVLFYTHHIPYVGFFLAAALSVVAVAFCLGEMEDEENTEARENKYIALTVIMRRIGETISIGFQIFKSSRAILTFVLVYASYRFVLNIIDYLWPVYLRSKTSIEQQTFYWIGLIIAIQLISILGSHTLSFWSHHWGKKKGFKTDNAALRRWFIGTCLFAALPVLALSWLTSRGLDTFWLFAAAILPVEFAYGLIAPCYDTLINNYIPAQYSGQRATILSFGSMLRSVLIMLLIIPSGGSSGATTTIGWAIPAFLLLVTAIAGNFVLKRKESSFIASTVKSVSSIGVVS